MVSPFPIWKMTKVYSILLHMKSLAVTLPNGLVCLPLLTWTDLESPDRVKNIKSHLEKFPDTFPITTSIKDFGMDPILAIHDRDYVEYLQTIFEQWYSVSCHGTENRVKEG